MVGGAAIVTGALRITRSILSSDGVVGDAVTAPDLDATLCNVTILGPSRFRSLEGTNVIFAAPVTVTRSQSGCLRYSFVPPGSATPRHFRCQPDLAFAAVAMVKGAPLTEPEKRHLAQATAPLFLDTSLDEPTVAMFHPRCPDAIRAGGEGDTEMGAFSDMAEALRRANLTSLFDDYVPFGLTAGLVDDTRSTATTLQRNRP